MSSLHASTASNSLFSRDLEHCKKHHQANELMMSMRIIASTTQLPRWSDYRIIPNRYLLARCSEHCLGVRAVVLVLVTAAAFWSWACAWGQKWVAVAALGSSRGFRGWRQGFPGWRSVAYRSGAPSGLDWRRAGPRFAPPRPDPPLSDAPAPDRWRERQALSGRPPRARSAQPLPLASPARMAERAGPNLRSSAWSPATSQVPELLPRLSAWVPRRKIAKPGWLQHRYKSPPDSGRSLLVRLAFSSRFLLQGDDHELPFFPKSRRRGDEGSLKERHPTPRAFARLYLQDFGEGHVTVRQASR